MSQERVGLGPLVKTETLGRRALWETAAPVAEIPTKETRTCRDGGRGWRR
jgi:hypothetical protein